MMAPAVDVIIPTFKNEYWIRRCLRSMERARFPEINAVHIIDNGGDFDNSPALYAKESVPITVHRQRENLGWGFGLKEGLKHSRAEFVMFLNDDTEFERDPAALTNLLSHFSDPKVAAVGPATSTAMGLQAQPGPDVERVQLLIGFCVLLRRSLLKKIGGLDYSYNNGGDDIDLSIRFIKRGYKLICDRRVFVYHHAYKTGARVYGPAGVKGGWNSMEQTLDVYGRLYKKHGRDAVLNAIALPVHRGGVALEDARGLPEG